MNHYKYSPDGCVIEAIDSDEEEVIPYSDPPLPLADVELDEEDEEEEEEDDPLDDEEEEESTDE